MPAEAKFCTNCGTSLSDVPTEAQSTDTEETATTETAAETTATADETEAKAADGEPEAKPEESKPAAAEQATASTEQQTQAAPQPAQTSATAEATKKYATNYWAYLVDSLKHPYTMSGTYHKYFGLTSFIIVALLIALTIMMIANHAVSEVSGAASSLFGTEQISSAGSLGFSVAIRIFVLVFVIEIAMASVAYLTVHAMLGDRRLGYLDFLNQFAHFSNLAVFFTIIGFVLSLISGSIGSAVILYLAVIGSLGIEGIALVASVFKAEPTTHLDKIYAYIIGTFILGIAISIIGALFGAMLIGEIENVVGNLF
ncbi:hypothetical protein FC18_GL000150 [Lacticaseibacillus sharpeae JCM 1186 = DSM 20505]|uniref:Zinc-ribbon domain-containing protein n=2 Tax=Lacticaseibacillus sharpeae TaxID=1626 RepID=A0A0R1ZWS5_9LACO|nr:hypothetical protein FC18_GL000150 [Lacticaseibacillus sharpeae JCM 1186 = DSM 20505]